MEAGLSSRFVADHSQHVIATKRLQHVEDMRTEQAYIEREPPLVSLVELAGARGTVHVDDVLAVTPTDDRAIRRAESDGRLGQRIEDRLQIEGRAARGAASN
jgi:hypothetical protein